MEACHENYQHLWSQTKKILEVFKKHKHKKIFSGQLWWINRTSGICFVSAKVFACSHLSCVRAYLRHRWPKKVCFLLYIRTAEKEWILLEDGSCPEQECRSALKVFQRKLSACTSSNLIPTCMREFARSGTASKDVVSPFVLISDFKRASRVSSPNFQEMQI